MTLEPVTVTADQLRLLPRRDRETDRARPRASHSGDVNLASRYQTEDDSRCQLYRRYAAIVSVSGGRSRCCTSSQTYRINGKAELFERSAKEYEILAVGLPPTEGAATAAEGPGADPMRRRRVSRPFLSR